MKSGRCRVCGETFVGFRKDEYERVVGRHIYQEHRNEPIDKSIVRPI